MRECDFQGLRFLSLFHDEAGEVANDDPDGSLFPDVISSAFFFLSLHEEWSSDRRDEFDRFQSQDSLLGTHGMLDRPVVAEHAFALRAFLAHHGLLSGRTIPGGGPPVVCLTHDIDHIAKFTPGLFRRELFRYLLKNELGASPRDRFRRFAQYLAFSRAEQDPYLLSIDRMLDQTRARSFRSTYFLKFGRTDKRDGSMNLRSPRIAGRIVRMKEDGHEIGVHPSFRSYDTPALIAGEARSLESLVGRPVRSVRQHYLRFRYPDTWRHQIDAGLTADSTLGFAEREGLRNGTCHPFLPYDLDRDSVLPIWEVPLIAMDGTFTSYRNLDPGRSLERIRSLFRIVRSVDGMFVILFHNNCYDEHDFPGWSSVFESFLDDCQAEEALVLPVGEALEHWRSRSGYADIGRIVSVVNGEY